MAPRPDLQVPGLEFLADLHLTFEDGSKTAAAHLSGGPDDLVLDVDHPVTMLRAAPRRSWPEGFDVPLLDSLAGTSVRVTSQGRTVGRLAVKSNGRPQFRPSLAGLVLPATSAIASRRAQIIGAATLALAATAVAISRARRH